MFPNLCGIYSEAHEVQMVGTWIYYTCILYAPCKCVVNTLRPEQNGRHFTDDIFNCNFFNENFRISIKISLKFVSKGPIHSKSGLV